jgi:hypothetical protein
MPLSVGNMAGATRVARIGDFPGPDVAVSTKPLAQGSGNVDKAPAPWRHRNEVRAEVRSPW